MCLASVSSFAKPAKNGINLKGLYRISRNPMYVSYFIYFLGCVLLTQSLLLLAILVAFQISTHWIILSEERWCIKKFGEKGELDHYIGVATSSNETLDFDVLSIEPGTWAVFESIGPFPETLQNVWGRIYSEWFPSSGYEVTIGLEILWNESPNTDNPNYRSEIWIPVKKRNN